MACGDPISALHYGAADAEVKVEKLTNGLLLKPGRVQSTAMHTATAARDFFLVLISTTGPFTFIVFPNLPLL